MTYCCGILVRDGLVMFADTRTNAGLDNISTFRKLHVFSEPGERIMAIASVGQPVDQPVGRQHADARACENPETGETETLMNAPTMFQAAQRVGRTIRQVHNAKGRARGRRREVRRLVPVRRPDQGRAAAPVPALRAPATSSNAPPDTPYLQIGEHKYGKPVLDRAITYDIDLYDALKIGLVSVDSTMRSNLSVGMPLDILVARRDAYEAELNYRIEPGEPYFHDLRERWSAALRAAHINIPRPPYKSAR